MTRNKLLELYIKLKKENLNVQDIKPLRNYTDEDIDIILNSKYLDIMINVIPNYEFRLLNQEDRQEIIDLINNAPNKDIAAYIFYIVRSKTVLSSGLTCDLARIICNSEPVSVKYATDTALNVNVLLNKNVLELVKIVASSKEEYQASCSQEVATNIEVLMSGNVVELTKIASQTEGKEQSALVKSIAKNRDVISRGLSIKLTKLGSKVRSDKIANLIEEIASNKLLEKNKSSVYYITRMISSEIYDDFFNIYNEATELIKKLKVQESKNKNDKSLFWNQYKEDPNETMALLISNYSAKEEITPYTRIRKKK